MNELRIENPDWDCPNCGGNGALMERPGSKDTCANCFHVVNGRYNGKELKDYNLTFRQARRLLYILGEPWHGTPGDVGTALRRPFNSPDELNAFLEDVREDATQPGVFQRVIDRIRSIRGGD